MQLIQQIAQTIVTKSDEGLKQLDNNYKDSQLNNSLTLANVLQFLMDRIMVKQKSAIQQLDQADDDFRAGVDRRIQNIVHRVGKKQQQAGNQIVQNIKYQGQNVTYGQEVVYADNNYTNERAYVQQQYQQYQRQQQYQNYQCQQKCQQQLEIVAGNQPYQNENNNNNDNDNADQLYSYAHSNANPAIIKQMSVQYPINIPQFNQNNFVQSNSSLQNHENNNNENHDDGLYSYAREQINHSIMHQLSMQAQPEQVTYISTDNNVNDNIIINDNDDKTGEQYFPQIQSNIQNNDNPQYQYKPEYKTRNHGNNNIDDKHGLNQIAKSYEIPKKYNQTQQNKLFNQSGSKNRSNKIQTTSQAKIPQDDSHKIYKINKSSVRKHSVKKQKQAQSQMMANIEFLKNLRGSSTKSSKNQWKQQTSTIKSALEQAKQIKKKKLQQMGFTQSTKQLHSKLQLSQLSSNGNSDIYYGSPGRSQFLPQIRKSRKSGQAYKPAAFSVYTIQRDNQIFHNKFIK